MATEPASGASRPTDRLTDVLLPAPFGPSRPRISPLRTASERPSTATVFPNDFRTLERVNMDTDLYVQPGAGFGSTGSNGGFYKSSGWVQLINRHRTHRHPPAHPRQRSLRHVGDCGGCC